MVSLCNQWSNYKKTFFIIIKLFPPLYDVFDGARHLCAYIHKLVIKIVQAKALFVLKKQRLCTHTTVTGGGDKRIHKNGGGGETLTTLPFRLHGEGFGQRFVFPFVFLLPFLRSNLVVCCFNGGMSMG